MKARKFKVNPKSCAGTFFYSHGVLIFGGLFLFFFVFTMDEIKKYCQPGVYVPCFHFSCLYRSMYSINDTQQTFCGFIFAEIPSKNTFISQLVFLHSDLQNGWFLHMLFWSQQDLRSCHIWPLEIMFRPNLACMLLVQCWQPFTMLGLPSGEKGWMYLGQFSYVEIALWASFLQGLVLLHCNWGEFSPCPQLGLGQTPVCLAFRHQHNSPHPSSAWQCLLGNLTSSVSKLASALSLPCLPSPVCCLSLPPPITTDTDVLQWANASLQRKGKKSLMCHPLPGGSAPLSPVLFVFSITAPQDKGCAFCVCELPPHRRYRQ